MIIQVYDDDLLNGEGIREVVYLQGCPHHCKGCFNPETWEFKDDTDKTIEKSCKFYLHLDHQLNKNYIDGITLTGGDPLTPSNLQETKDLINLAKQYNKTVWVYTGYTWEDLFFRFDENKTFDILKQIDVLCDGQFIEELKSLDKPWVGSSNQRVIDVQKSLKERKIVLYEN